MARTPCSPGLLDQSARYGVLAEIEALGLDLLELRKGGRCCSPAASSGAAWTCPGSMTCSVRVYYGAGPSEALARRDSQVVVVGGGNSAGQAVVRFSRYAKQVTFLVRGRDLGASMSQYLIDQVSAIPDVDVRVRTRHLNATASGRSSPPEVPTRAAWSAPSSPTAPKADRCSSRLPAAASWVRSCRVRGR